MPIFFLVLSLITFRAYADNSVERLCFTSASEAQRAIPILNTVLVKGQDEIQPEGLCLNVLYAPRRAELLDRWIRARLPEAQRAFSTYNAPREKCDMRLYKQTMRKKIQTQMGADGQTIMIGTDELEVESEETSTLTVLSGETVELMANQQNIAVNCIKKGDGRYLLKFALKPVPLQVPNVTNPSQPLQVPPPDAQALSTSLEVGAGQEVSLGEILRTLSNENKGASASPSVQMNQNAGTENIKWTLKVL